MKIVIDTHVLTQQGVIDARMAQLLEQHALRSGGMLAINLLIGLGMVALTTGVLALFPKPLFAVLFGAGFCVLGIVVRDCCSPQWGKLAAVWMIVGALVLAAGTVALIDKPVGAMLLAAAILSGMAILAKSSLLAALVPLALLGAIGGSSGYWQGCYMIAVQEPFITLVVFVPMAWGAWCVSRMTAGTVYERLSLVAARMSVVVVNMAFWVGSLWGSQVGKLFGDVWFTIDEMVFVLGWALALFLAGVWAAANGRRFMVNTVAVFGSIHAYTQWFELLQFSPLTVMAAGATTIAIGIVLWQYNRQNIQGSVGTGGRVGEAVEDVSAGVASGGAESAGVESSGAETAGGKLSGGV